MYPTHQCCKGGTKAAFAASMCHKGSAERMSARSSLKGQYLEPFKSILSALLSSLAFFIRQLVNARERESLYYGFKSQAFFEILSFLVAIDIRSQSKS